MKKLITSLFVLMAITFALPAQTAWNQIRLTNVATVLVNQDTSYVSIACRNGKFQVLGHSALTGRLKGMAGVAAYDAGDSITWRIIKGTAVGTSPRVRFINVRTGQYLYIGTHGGAANIAYMAPREDTYGGIKDLVLNDQGVNGTTYYYYIRSANLTGNPSLYNDVTDSINVKTGDQGWKFIVKKGPQPKTVVMPVPTLSLTTSTALLSSGGSIALDAQVTKGATDLLGTASLYYGSTLLTALSLDADGKASYTYNGLLYGEQKFVLVYSGDVNYDPEDATLSVTAGPNVNAKAVNVTIIPSKTSSEVHTDFPVSFTVKDANGDPVSTGTLKVMVNNNTKNTFTPDALGTASVNFPNLLAGDVAIQAKYIGDKNNYLDSDTAKVIVTVTPSSSSIIPYPVYYDLGTMPEIMKYRLKYTSAATARVSVNFAADSLSNFSLSTDRLDSVFTRTMYATWAPGGLTAAPAKTADYYGASDAFNVPFGNGVRPNWMSFKTPWLNKGSYNVYMNQRTNLTNGMVTTTTMDGKSLYYPNAELTTFSIRGANNNKRRWNTNANDALNQMHYLGSVVLDASGQHILKLTCTTGESAANQVAWLDMMEFIPVDQDSLNVNMTSAVGLAKTYFPLFNSGGYASMALASFTTYANSTELAVPYQVTDLTNYTKAPYTLQHLAVTNPDLGLTGVDYVVIYKSDKWTRVNEGAVSTSDSTFISDLADGDYYYREYNYTESSTTTGALGTRLWMKDGTFTVDNQTAVKNVNSTNIRTFAVERTLTVKGIKAGAKIMVADLMGRVILNTVSTSDVFTSTMKQGSVYIVKVVSGNDYTTTKVIVK